MAVGRSESSKSAVYKGAGQCRRTVVASADGEQNLTDRHASDEAVGLAERTAHAGLQPIGASARQHLVDADDVVRVGADAEVEAVLAAGLDHVPL